MKKSQARGYLLEIVISKLIENNGYNVIRKSDGKEIIGKSNGLNVKGRGGYHQFDTLGQFRITPPFVYPIRLFVEAKFYESDKVGIDRVRMGVGILDDVNTNYFTVEIDNNKLSTQRYHYHYAIFSRSGFTEAAQRYAIAHKIHLIDLSGSEYKIIVDLIIKIVDELSRISSNEIEDISNSEFKNFKKWLEILFYDGEMKQRGMSVMEDMLHSEMYKLILELLNYTNSNYIYLATTESPYIIPLLSNHEFHQLLSEQPHHEVYLTWNREYPNNWTITSKMNDDMRISFTLPELLRDLLFSDKDILDNNALYIKEHRMSNFAFITYFDNNPTLCTLKYSKEGTYRYLEGITR